MGTWEHFEHQADIGVRGIGASPAEAFEQAALAMMAVIADPATVEPREEIRIACEAPDLELLLVDWLNAVIAEVAQRRMLFRSFAVRIEGPRLRATARGDSIQAKRHQPAVEVKGATYAELRVGRRPDGTWVAQCVVDV
jgi:SHS2 domain-containing protein